MHEAKDHAVSRPSGGDDGVWCLSTDAASTTVKAPGGPVDSGCVPIGLEPIDAQAAYLLSADGVLRATKDGGQSLQTRSTVVGAASISFTDAKSGFALAPPFECPVTVLATADGSRDSTRVHPRSRHRLPPSADISMPRGPSAPTEHLPGPPKPVAEPEPLRPTRSRERP